ncbi:Sodium/potassium/calcium exchanger 1 [Bagarius yarrelli]|uniref:Sodium/potassium/calcium exchanger 1 n=1 Tax=Bagarius yarrelli TaxID=175774 RepID=A0A556V6U0_BAGYA|nr:Sodium/potassium/calcium exchanger 1 [Bagarius yarrelli]
MYLTRRKRLHLTRIIFLLSGVLLCCIYQLTVRTRSPEPWPEYQIGENPKVDHEDVTEGLIVKPGVTDKQTTAVEGILTHTEHKPDQPASTTPLKTDGAESTVLHPVTTTNRTIVRCIYVEPDLPKPTPVPTPAPEPTNPTATISSPTEPPHVKGEYPQDIFSIEERRKGWVFLHIFGMIYMFVSLAIVCDEFFVPTLGEITKKLEISDDVAGATFMAAGGSAPELFTSLIGVFISHSNVGIGTIVGSAVFNILFVIGMCALFSREMLYLTWWPLFRDVSFYILDLIMLIIFFLDNTIMWWESIMLVAGYAIYVYFMKYNVQIERAFKSQLRRHKNIVKVIPVEEPEKENGTTVEDNSTPEPEDKNHLKLKPTLQRGGSSASLHNSTMRNTIFQLMIHTLDPLGEDSVLNGGTMPSSSFGGKVKFKEKAQILNSMARGKVVGKEKEKTGKGEDNTEETKESKDPAPAPSNTTETKEKSEGLKVGETIGISEEIMGLTILAAGTSIPDLITSVIVARKGLGDMAVSSSVGSNIFDITVGLPVPWLMFSMVHGLAPVAVSSNGLFCAIVLLFLMLLFVIISIAVCKWKMNKMLGFTMFMLYFVFLVLSVMLEDRIIICPVSI